MRALMVLTITTHSTFHVGLESWLDRMGSADANVDEKWRYHRLHVNEQQKAHHASTSSTLKAYALIDESLFFDAP